MAGFLDKIKGMFAKKPAADGTGGAGGGAMSTIKEKAGEVKEKIPEPVKEAYEKVADKVEEIGDKIGEKMPEPVKNAYEKVSDKIEDMMPGGDAKDQVADADDEVADAATGAAATVEETVDDATP
jgi:methyl-accepting chemotaxis protein